MNSIGNQTLIEHSGAGASYEFRIARAAMWRLSSFA
jgi:hypothetical protein